VSEFLSLIIGTIRSAVRGRNDLILENLLLRQQLQVALRPRRRLSLQPRDRLFWGLVRRIVPDWRHYLLYVRPEIHDRDGVYGADFDARMARLGIRGIRTPVMAPRANAVAERMAGTFRLECLDHLIVLNEQQLRSLLSEFVTYYNRYRPHRSLALKTPEVMDRRQAGKLVCRPILGGLHHSYEWAA